MIDPTLYSKIIDYCESIGLSVDVITIDEISDNTKKLTLMLNVKDSSIAGIKVVQTVSDFKYLSLIFENIEKVVRRAVKSQLSDEVFKLGEEK